MRSKLIDVDLTSQEVNALVQKIGGPDKVRRFLRGELKMVKVCSSRETEESIYLSVTSDGTTGQEWIDRLENAGVGLNGYTKKILESPDFIPTRGVETAVVVLRAEFLKEKERSMTKMHQVGASRNLLAPSIEVACLLREKLSNQDFADMNLRSITVMHESVAVGATQYLLSLSGADAKRRIDTCNVSVRRRRKDIGFAFAAPSGSM